jgi:hypothetical protein
MMGTRDCWQGISTNISNVPNTPTAAIAGASDKE